MLSTEDSNFKELFGVNNMRYRLNVDAKCYLLKIAYTLVAVDGMCNVVCTQSRLHRNAIF